MRRMDAPNAGELLLARAANARSSGASARSKVHALLRTRIVSLDLPPGTALSENELAAELQVSRTPVREGLILLAEEALTEVYPRLGTFVARIRLGDVADAQFIREAIELAGLRASVGRAGADDIAELRELMRAQREAVAASRVVEFFELDEAFHRRLLDVSGHLASWKVVHTAKAHLDRVRRLSLPMPHIIGRMIDQHETVVDRLAAADAEGAEDALRGHLRAVLDDLDEIRSRYPAYFA